MELKDTVNEARKAIDEAKHDVNSGMPGQKK